MPGVFYVLNSSAAVRLHLLTGFGVIITGRKPRVTVHVFSETDVVCRTEHTLDRSSVTTKALCRVTRLYPSNPT